MDKIRIGHRVQHPTPAFQDRAEAGEALAAFVDPPPAGEEAYVLGLPRGGIPVAAPLARHLAASLAPVFVRKLPIPQAPEMGFGAVALDGSVMLNDRVVQEFALDPDTIDAVAEEVREEVRRRARVYQKSDQPPVVAGKHVFVVDDGLATGYTAAAAAAMLRHLAPRSLRLTVPVTPVRTLATVEPQFDRIECLLVQRGGSFAVASFYQDFHDLSDDEVRNRLAEAAPRAGAHRERPHPGKPGH